MPTAADQTTTFSQTQYSEAYPQGVERHYWHLVRNRAVQAALRELPAGEILDVGCGRGILVDHLQRAGLPCLGVELAADVPVPEHLKDRVFVGTAAKDLPAATRDRIGTIILADVLEHLPEPAVFLRDLRDSFSNLKHFLITVPARQEIWSNYDEHYGHVLRYDRAQLSHVLAEAGARTLHSRYFFRVLYPPALGLAVLNRKRAVHVPAPSDNAAGVHRALAHLLTAWDHLMPHGVYGASIIAVAAVEP